MALFPGPLKDAVAQLGIFDFDGAIFQSLWGSTKEQREKFFQYVQYYISDHRPLWAELRLSDV